MSDHPRWHREDAIAKRNAVQATTPDVMWRTFEDNLDWNLWDRLAALTVPVHVVAADPSEGALFLESHGRRLQAVKTDLTYEVATGTGHSVFRDDVSVVAGAALRLL
jgi:pimeloyl-ACP methyl ester carboxylesterase